LISGSTIERFKLEKLDLSHNLKIKDPSLMAITSLRILTILGRCRVTAKAIKSLPYLTTLTSDRADFLSEIGRGTGIYGDGSRYIGGWGNFVKTGTGTLFGSDGIYYVGDWQNDCFHGKGILVSADGEYDGDWVNGKKHGHGTMKYADDMVYVGSWVAGMRQGRGTLRKDGHKFHGTWYLDQRDGPGIITYRSGQQYCGFWFEDQLINEPSRKIIFLPHNMVFGSR